MKIICLSLFLVLFLPNLVFADDYELICSEVRDIIEVCYESTTDQNDMNDCVMNGFSEWYSETGSLDSFDRVANAEPPE